jgi:hypothetical protein
VLAGLCDWYFVLYLMLFTGLAVLMNWLVGLRETGVGTAVAEGGVWAAGIVDQPAPAAGDRRTLCRGA